MGETEVKALLRDIDKISGTDAVCQERPRKPHVVADRASRVLKARKIISIVGRSRFLRCGRILEIGCGSGFIAHSLAKAGTNAQSVDAVDVVDSRTEKRGYHFRLVTGTTLPFEDGAFDLVVTNHVIEHVGDESMQIAHLTEVKRVTASDGLVYFAVPNKWRLVEPHYRLPLLSWFPQGVSDAYLRFARRATHYDCVPRSRGGLQHLFKVAGFNYEDQTISALRQTLALEHKNLLATRIINSICPDWLLTCSLPVIPTLVFLLRHKPS